MDTKEFNILLNEISEKLNPLNQLLYQCLILIVFYYFFITVKKLESHKCFIILFAIICSILDLCIWNNTNQTILFMAILGIYITYNIKKDISIDNFISTMNNINNNKNDSITDLWLKEEIEKKNKNEIDSITFVPKNIYEKGNKNQNNNSNSNLSYPEPYDKVQSEINEINLVYKTDTSNVHSIDTQYENTMLSNLYGTPQYKNIKKNKIDKSLDDNIHFSNNNNNNNIINKNNNIELFRKPKVQFLDDSWLSNKDNSYNDNCKSNKCIDTHNKNNTNNTSKINNNTSNTNNTRNKNAICSLYEFGTTLSECTNQSNTITDNQLDKISTNEINPINPINPINTS